MFRKGKSMSRCPRRNNTSRFERQWRRSKDWQINSGKIRNSAMELVTVCRQLLGSQISDLEGIENTESVFELEPSQVVHFANFTVNPETRGFLFVSSEAAWVACASNTQARVQKFANQNEANASLRNTEATKIVRDETNWAMGNARPNK